MACQYNLHFTDILLYTYVAQLSWKYVVELSRGLGKLPALASLSRFLIKAFLSTVNGRPSSSATETGVKDGENSFQRDLHSKSPMYLTHMNFGSSVCGCTGIVEQYGTYSNPL